MKLKLLIPAAVIVVGGIALWSMNAARNQSTAAVSGGAPLVEVNLPSLSPMAEVGKATFDGNCAACHGVNAAGKDGFGPPLVHKIYEPNHHGDMAFFVAAKSGVRAHHWTFGNMPPVEGITDDQLGPIVAYIRELQRANGIF